MNVRIIAVMSGGILFGPWVGIITGVIAGIHRYLIDIGGVTAIPCFITSILAGCISGWINLKIPKAQRWRVGILGGMLCETLTMILVIVWAPTTALGIDIVSKIGIPMILGSVCIGFIVLLVQSVEGEKEASAARQAKLALDIANKTLPLFRHVNSESLRKVCEIIRVIAGIHRYLIDIGGVTAIPCFITSILAGCISGWINLKIPKAQRWRVGILGGMLCETLTMILVIVWAPTTALGIDIVSKIGIPMILGSVCIGFIVLLVQSVEGEKEASAARQAKLALDIANKTLPLFRHVNSESLRKVCEIIRDDIHADAVAITNTDHVLAYVGVGEHNYQNGDDFISPTTRQAMNYGKIIIKNNDEAHRTPEIHSMLVITEKSSLKTMMKPTAHQRFIPCWWPTAHQRFIPCW